MDFNPDATSLQTPMMKIKKVDDEVIRPLQVELIGISVEALVCLWQRCAFRLKDGGQVGAEPLTEIVELIGIEPTASSLRTRRSPS